MKIVDGGITKPIGFEAGAVAAGIKYKDRPDMAVVYSETPCEVAGVFTRNAVKAAPVLWDKRVVESGKKCHTVVINSGIANACTGKAGMDCCEITAQAAAENFDVDCEGVLICSTGVIGMQIPTDKIKLGIEKLVQAKANTAAAAQAAARAIMTTDTHEKEVAVQFNIGEKTVTVAGMAKGSGMIHPDMCTMLGFITTDANISKEALSRALSEDVERSFNMVSVDGDTSTNDTVLLLANGRAGNDKIETDTEEYTLFARALSEVTITLSKMIAADGEGATALLEVIVEGAQTVEQARVIAKSIVTSSLTKTAIAGHDANWGRVLCAMGYSGAELEPQSVTLRFESSAGRVTVFEMGTPVTFDEELATNILSENEVRIVAHLGMGSECAVAWGCDLTHDYISINADYRS